MDVSLPLSSEGSVRWSRSVHSRSDASDSLVLHSPESLEISDVPSVLVSESQVLSLSDVMGLSSSIVSVVSDGVSP